MKYLNIYKKKTTSSVSKVIFYSNLHKSMGRTPVLTTDKELTFLCHHNTAATIV